MTMKQSELDTILDKHHRWMIDVTHGKRADLTNTAVEGLDLSHRNLAGANLMHANLRNANLRGANLIAANLLGANLDGADLVNTKLWKTIGNGEEIKTLVLGTYVVTYTHDRLQIGCENHSIELWWKFDDFDIEQMDGAGALEFWAEHRDMIELVIKQFPAVAPRKE